MNFPLGLTLIIHLLVILFIALKKKPILLVSLAILLVFAGISIHRIRSIVTLLRAPDNITVSTANTQPPTTLCQHPDKNPSEKKTVILRLDDYQAFSWTDISIRMVNEANKSGIPMVLGVIPVNIQESNEAVHFLQDTKCTNEIALHGWNHQAAEFAKLNYEQARETAQKGKSVLEEVTGQQIISFIPPENLISIDARKALYDLGFSVISTNSNGEFDTNTAFYNYEKKNTLRADEIWSRCEELFRASEKCIVMVHPQDFIGENKKIDETAFEQFLILLKKIESEGVRVTTFSGLNAKVANNVQTSDSVPASTWIADWDYNDTISYVAKNQNIQTVLPFLYEINEDGEIKPIKTKLFASLRNLPKHVMIMPTVVNRLESARAHTFLDKKDLWKGYIDYLVDESVRQNFIGLDIDIENIDPKYQDKYLEFLSVLSTQLHANKLRLSVTIPIKSEGGGWEVAKAYEWEKIAEIADEVRIMAYDVHNQPNKPGSIIPLVDLKLNLQLAIQSIPKEKIIIALPTYAYDWNQGKVDSLQYSDLRQIIDKYGSPTIDKNSRSAFLKYVDQKNNKHEMWFETSTTLREKMDLVRQSGVDKFSFWRLGNHDPALLK